MAEIATTAPRARLIGVWVLRLMVAALFLFTGAMKIIGHPMMIHEFATIGLGQWFRYFTAILEIGGAISVMIPRWSVLGAVLVLVVDIGAFFAQAFVLRMDVIHPFVIGAVICALIYLQRARLRELFRTR